MQHSFIGNSLKTTTKSSVIPVDENSVLLRAAFATEIVSTKSKRILKISILNLKQKICFLQIELLKISSYMLSVKFGQKIETNLL